MRKVFSILVAIGCYNHFQSTPSAPSRAPTRHETTDSLRPVGPRPSINVLLDDIDGTDAKRIQALNWLGDMGESAAVATPRLIDSVHFSNRPKWPIAICLGRIGSPEKVVSQFLFDTYAKSLPGSADQTSALLGLAFMGSKALGVSSQIESDFSIKTVSPKLDNRYELALAIISINPTSAKTDAALIRILEGDPSWPADAELPGFIAVISKDDRAVEGNPALVPARWRFLALRRAIGVILETPALREKLAMALMPATPRFQQLFPAPVAKVEPVSGGSGRNAQGGSGSNPPRIQPPTSKRTDQEIDDYLREGTRKTPDVPLKKLDPPRNSDEANKFFQAVIDGDGKPNKAVAALSAQSIPVSQQQPVAMRLVILRELQERSRLKVDPEDSQIEAGIDKIDSNDGTSPPAILAGIGQLGVDNNNVEQLLISYLLSGETTERARAAQALGRLAPRDKSVLEALTRSADRDPNPVVRATARWAVSKMSPQKP